MSLEENLNQLEATAANRITRSETIPELDEARRALLGKKGELTLLLRGMGSVPPAERPRAGQLVNETRARLEALLDERQSTLARREQDALLAAETIDVTLPAPEAAFGRRHPIMQTWDDIVRIFSNLGYSVVEGPEVETHWYNFDALNIGPDHPARDERDSLFVGDSLVMRTETSAVQIRTMENREPPVQIIAPGRVYRRDAVDRTHSAIFHQVEGLLVSEGVTFGDLKGTLSTFLQQLFDEAPGSGGLKTRFRPHFFPFTEPSAEFDVFFKGDWLELGGCGMVHPKVLETVGYDSEKYTGFAFGFGIERMTMIKFDIDDLRLFYDNDWRFLEQF
ncbi:MAG: phenylalanyl-tRNA synthetase alpha chain [Abditibacteriota bacterium]|nr:phenylalanyl-tRNA synthetase alpha chain [Abditibacteriota bacterium]